jgi:UDP-N-acetylmuramate dehydrogenase
VALPAADGPADAESLLSPPLAPFTTLGLGGSARRLVQVNDTDSLVQAVLAADAEQEPLLLLGGGSNVVIADAGFDGTAVLIRTRGVTWGDEGSSRLVTAAAGEPWDALVRAAVERGLAGIECLAGIPGTVGAGPLQNIGAYGQELAQTCVGVQVLDRVTGERMSLTAAECAFGYRDSRFKRDDRFVVLTVTLELRRAGDGRSDPVRYAQLASELRVAIGETAPLADVMAAVVALRREKAMVLDPAEPDARSVGSFFVNPVLTDVQFADLVSQLGREPAHWPGPDGVKVSAAWLVEQAGFARGYGPGPVRVSTRHTLALTHPGGGSTSELIALADEIVAGVFAASGVTLRAEPRLVGVALGQ